MIPLLPLETQLRRIVTAVNQLVAGRSNAAGAVTLAAGASETVVTNEAIAATSLPQLTPAGGTWTDRTVWVKAVGRGTLTIGHSNEATTDRVVHWHAVGG